eukprot:5635523-Lingulodinium_polyedra.AAC.1
MHVCKGPPAGGLQAGHRSLIHGGHARNLCRKPCNRRPWDACTDCSSMTRQGLRSAAAGPAAG